MLCKFCPVNKTANRKAAKIEQKNAVLLSKKVIKSIVKIKTVLRQWPGRVKSTTIWSTGQDKRTLQWNMFCPSWWILGWPDRTMVDNEVMSPSCLTVLLSRKPPPDEHIRRNTVSRLILRNYHLSFLRGSLLLFLF